MASPLKSLTITLLLLAINAIVGSHAQAGKNAILHAVGRQQSVQIASPEDNKPPFTAGPWKRAHATFYEEGDIKNYGGACGYKTEMDNIYGKSTAALSYALFKDGKTCGACYEIRCVDDPQWCKPGQPSLTVTATNSCPPNWALPSDNGGWCNPPREHFDIAYPVFSHIAEYKAGIVPVEYRRVPCQRQGGVRFTINGHYYFYQITVSNVAGAGDVTSVQVKGDKKQLEWIQLERDWGSTWKTGAILAGESLTFRVGTSDGKFSTSHNVATKNWQFGQSFVGQNFS